MAKDPSQTKRKTIGDTVYIVTPLGGTDGIEVYARLMNTIGPVLQGFAASVQEAKGSGPEAEQTAFLATLGRALASLKATDLLFFRDHFSPCTELEIREGAAVRKPLLRDVVEDHFTPARFADLFVWLIFCIEVNYGDFFGGGWTRIKDALPSSIWEKIGSS